jgi:hypothetical protein
MRKMAFASALLRVSLYAQWLHGVEDSRGYKRLV